METTKPNPHQTAKAYYTLFLSLPEDVQREIRQMIESIENRSAGTENNIGNLLIAGKWQSASTYRREEMYDDDERGE